MKITKLLLPIIMLFEIAGCAKTNNNKTNNSSETTTQKTATFSDLWLFKKNETGYNALTMTEKAESNNCMSNNTYCGITARKDIRIKSVSYTFENASSMSYYVYDFNESNARYDKNNNIYLLFSLSEASTKEIASGETWNNTINYNNLIVKKGEELYIRLCTKLGSHNKDCHFYNFVFEYEEVK